MKRPRILKPFVFINNFPAFHMVWDGMSFNPFRVSGIVEWVGVLLVLTIPAFLVILLLYALQAIGVIQFVP